MTLHDELTTGPLAAELAPLIAEGNDGAILAVLNRKDIPAKGVIATKEIWKYLGVHRILRALETSNSEYCKEAIRNLEIFDTFELNDPEIFAVYATILSVLEMDESIPFTAQHKVDLLAMGDVLISRAEQTGISPTLEAIRAAIWNDDGSRKL